MFLFPFFVLFIYLLSFVILSTPTQNTHRPQTRPHGQKIIETGVGSQLDRRETPQPTGEITVHVGGRLGLGAYTSIPTYFSMHPNPRDRETSFITTYGIETSLKSTDLVKSIPLN